MQERIQAAKDRITELIRENTRLLEQYNVLSNEKKGYEVDLDYRQKNLVIIDFAADYLINKQLYKQYDYHLIIVLLQFS